MMQSMAGRCFVKQFRWLTPAIVGFAGEVGARERRRPYEALHGKTDGLSHGEAMSTPSILLFVLGGGQAPPCEAMPNVVSLCHAKPCRLRRLGNLFGSSIPVRQATESTRRQGFASFVKRQVDEQSEQGLGGTGEPNGSQ